MTAPASEFTFPGIHGCVSGSYTIKPVTAPGEIRIVSPDSTLHRQIPKRGPVVIRHGSRSLTLLDCTLDSVSSSTGGDGKRLLTFKLLDRRHRWQEGHIAGEYNVREGQHGSLKESTRKHARDLGKLASEAMGEPRVNLRALPATLFPETSWSGLPAEALNQLCDATSCRVVFDPGSNRTALHRIGTGKPLPNGPLVSNSYGLDTPELPDAFAFLTAPTWFEVDLELEAVIQDPAKDDKLVKIEDASFKPAGGWATTRPPSPPTVKAEFAELAARQLYRWYRPKLPIKAWGETITDLWRILPLLNHRATLYFLDDSDENRKLLEPAIYGKYHDGNEAGRLAKGFFNTPAGKLTRWQRDFDLDGPQGVFRFGEPVFRQVDLAGNDIVAPADPAKIRTLPAKLWVRLAVQIRDESTGAWQRYQLTEKTRGPRLGTPPHYIGRTDTRLVQWKTYTGPTKELDNAKEVEAIGGAYLADEINRYTTKESGTRTYAGFVPYSCDGAISQVTYNLDASGRFTTTISREREELAVALSMRQVRERQQAAELIREARQGLGVKS